MSGKFSFNHNKVRQIPQGEPFIMLSQEMLCSHAWRARSISCIRLIEFLMVEHLNHAGKENGNLIATYDQLNNIGIGRRLITSAIWEAEQLGLLLVERGGRRSIALSHVNKFTLTFLIAKQTNNNGLVCYYTPTNDWRRINEQHILVIRGQLTVMKSHKKKAQLKSYTKSENSITKVH